VAGGVDAGGFGAGVMGSGCGGGVMAAGGSPGVEVTAPDVGETLPGFESAAWFGVVAPPGTPREFVAKINADINEALRQPEIQEKMANLSAETIGGTPEATAAYMREEVDRWAKVIKAAGVKLE